jgi:hypothetical protein
LHLSLDAMREGFKKMSIRAGEKFAPYGFLGSLRQRKDRFGVNG